MRVADLQRSLRRWLVFALDDDTWVLRDERAEIADDERPAGYVEASAPMSLGFARASIPQGAVQRRVTMTATMYPATTGTADECGVRARELADVLDRGVQVGLAVPQGTLLPGPGLLPSPDLLPGSTQWLATYPLSIPLWDFAGVAPDEPGPQAPVAAAEVESLTSRAIPDPLDDRRWTVVLELRLSWWAAGRSRLLPTEEPTVADIPGTFVP